MATCSFCNITDSVLENEYCRAFFDQSPVTTGHLLIIPIAHREDYFDLTVEERVAMYDLLQKGKRFLDETFAPDGYNIGFNLWGSNSPQLCCVKHGMIIKKG